MKLKTGTIGGTREEAHAMTLLIVLYGVSMLIAGFVAGFYTGRVPIPESEIGGRIGSVPVPANVPATDEPEGFAVAGKRRLPTWRERRRALERGSRTQREKIEEWRD